MEGESQLEEPTWGHHGYQAAPLAFRGSDIITVLSGLREEVNNVEAEIQKVETDLLSDPDNRVLNRKFERLLDEKRNKEARRERLELQLTAQSDHLVSGGATAPGLAAEGLHLSAQHPLYQVHVGAKRMREDGPPHDFQGPPLQGYLHAEAEGNPAQQHQHPPKGTGRGGKGGHKFCKRCKERITYGHQQKCKYCRKCYDDNKQLVLRTECPLGHDTSTGHQQPMLMSSIPLEQQQAALEAQQQQLQLHMHVAGVVPVPHLPASLSHHPMQQDLSQVRASSHEMSVMQGNRQGGGNLSQETVLPYQIAESQARTAHLQHSSLSLGSPDGSGPGSELRHHSQLEASVKIDEGQLKPAPGHDTFPNKEEESDGLGKYEQLAQSNSRQKAPKVDL